MDPDMVQDIFVTKNKIVDKTGLMQQAMASLSLIFQWEVLTPQQLWICLAQFNQKLVYFLVNVVD